jgi:hypothetical protein
MKNSVYNGVTRSVRCESRQWRAQCAAAGKNFHLGNFEIEEEAARAYDNVLYYLRDYGFSDSGRLNFPREYDVNPPPMTDTARRVILDCERRQGTQDPQQLPKSVARCLPLLRQIAEVVSELEEALAGRPAMQSEASNTQDKLPTTVEPSN